MGMGTIKEAGAYRTVSLCIPKAGVMSPRVVTDLRSHGGLGKGLGCRSVLSSITVPVLGASGLELRECLSVATG